MNQRELWEKSWYDLAKSRQDAPPEFLWGRIEAALPQSNSTRSNAASSFLRWVIFSLTFLVAGLAVHFLLNGDVSTDASAQELHAASPLSIGSADEATNKKPPYAPEAAGPVAAGGGVPTACQGKANNLLFEKQGGNGENLPHKPYDDRLSSAAPFIKSDVKAAKPDLAVHPQDFQMGGEWKMRTPAEAKFPYNGALHNESERSAARRAQTTDAALFEKSEWTAHKLPLRISGVLADQSQPIVASVSAVGKLGDCPKFAAAMNTHFFLSMEGGLGYPFKTLKSKTGESSNLSFRQRTETTILAWSVNLLGGVKFMRHFSISSGLLWQQNIEKFRYDRPGLIIITINPGIDTTIERRIFRRQTTNTYNYIDIPLIFGYDTGNEKWEFGLEAGPILNFEFSADGLLLAREDELLDVKSLKNYYRKNIGLGLHAGLSLHRIIEDNWSLFLKPQYRYYFTSTTAIGNPVDLRFQHAALSLGLRKIF